MLSRLSTLSSREELENILPDKAWSAPSVICFSNPLRSLTFSTSHTGGDKNRDQGDLWLRAGCFAKTLTAVLFAFAESQKLVSLESQISGIMKTAGCASYKYFEGITYAHLLTHTHGLDGSNLPLYKDEEPQRLSLHLLASMVSRRRRMALPGEVYSYSNTGPLIASLLLECILGHTYTDLLNEAAARILPTFNHVNLVESDGRACPASGGDLRIRAGGLSLLLSLLTGSNLGLRKNRRIVDTLRSMQRNIYPIKGWAMEAGSTPGAKYYGNGWFGHNAIFTNSCEGIMRFNPALQLGLVVSSASGNAAVMVNRLLKPSLPPYPKLPDAIDKSTLSRREKDAVTGLYTNSELSVTVNSEQDRSLSITVARTKQGGTTETVQTSTLLPRKEGLYIASPPNSDYFVVAQFHQNTMNGYTYLWNGREVLRNDDIQRL